MYRTKLIYLYIGDISRDIFDQSMLFTNDYEIKLENLGLTGKKRLILNQKENPFIDYWSNSGRNGNISSVNLLVGENGSGKSTIFDLLGTNSGERDRIFIGDKKTDLTWFALYEVSNSDKKEIQYIFEGDGLGVIDNIIMSTSKNKFGHKNSFIHKNVFIATYNKEERSFFGDKKISHEIIASLEYMYLTCRKSNTWSDIFGGRKRIQGRKCIEGNSIFRRKEIEKPSLKNLYGFMKYAGNFDFMRESFSAQNINCEVSFQVNRGFREFLNNEEGIKLYNGLQNPILEANLKSFSEVNGKVLSDGPTFETMSGEIRKQIFNINFLEFNVYSAIQSFFDANRWYRIKKSKKKCKNQKYDAFTLGFQKIRLESNSYDGAKNYLFKILKFVLTKMEKDFYNSKAYINNLHGFVHTVDALECAVENTGQKISISIAGEYDARIEDLLTTIDTIKMESGWIGDVGRLINVKFGNLSTGELDFINLFSRITSSLKFGDRYGTKNTVLILDEPDASFHPEWSRKFVSMLLAFLDTEKLSKEHNFQVIISSHSPFMISDFPKEYISTIEMQRNGETSEITRVITRGEYGLASNLYDVIKSDFFLKAPIGTYAEKYINDLISEIKNISNFKNASEENNDGKVDCKIKKVNRIRNRINGIDDALIKRKLLAMLEKEVDSELSLEFRIENLNAELEKLKCERARIINDKTK